MIFLDTETAGFETNRVIELAFIDSENGERFEKRYGLPEGEKIDLEAMSIHHITDKMIDGLPVFDEDGDYERVKEILSKEIMVCHNTKFDYREVLNAVYGVLVPRRICTLKLAKTLVPGLPRYNLQYLRYYFDLEFDEVIDPHAALSDVIVLEGVYKKLLEIAKERYPERSEEEIINGFIKVEARPVLLKDVTFGKYKGKKWSEVPLDYLQWIVKSDYDDEDAKFTAQKYLEKYSG